MAENDQIQERLNRLQRPAEKPSRLKQAALPAAMLAVGLGGGAYLVSVQPTSKPNQVMQTSEVSEFQEGGGLDGFTITRAQPEVDPVIQTEVKVVPADAAAKAIEAELAVAKAELDTARAELEAARNAQPDQTALDALREEIQQIKNESALKDQAFDDLTRENLRLQTELETAELLAGQQQMAVENEAQRLTALELRRAEEATLRAAEEEKMRARNASASVVYRAGGGAAGTTETIGGAVDEGADAAISASERFLRGGANRTEAIRAEFIGDPGRTVLQGTLIEATLTNAISSQIEGNVAATVSRDVWSFDMTNVVIPRGSKLFGRYSSDIARGQRRVMVAWDRVVTPDGQSAELSAYGADRIGRSGMTGRVNTHTLSRFAAAAAVSIISAAPAVLAAAMEKEQNDEISRETAENIGGNMSETVASMMQDYIDIPTTISIDQGAVVTVVVNADLEML